MQHIEMRFAGLGGQGILVMGDVIANAACLCEGKAICLRRAYGSEARGGTCQSELIIDAEEVDYPLVSECDFLMAMSQAAADKFAAEVLKGGVIVIDTDMVKNVPDSAADKTLYKVPCTAISKEITGRSVCSNIAALGAISVLYPQAAKADSLKKCIRSHFAEKFWEDNEKVFDAGVEAARKLID